MAKNNLVVTEDRFVAQHSVQRRQYKRFIYIPKRVLVFFDIQPGDLVDIDWNRVVVHRKPGVRREHSGSRPRREE